MAGQTRPELLTHGHPISTHHKSAQSGSQKPYGLGLQTVTHLAIQYPWIATMVAIGLTYGTIALVGYEVLFPPQSTIRLTQSWHVAQEPFTPQFAGEVQKASSKPENRRFPWKTVQSYLNAEGTHHQWYFNYLASLPAKIASNSPLSSEIQPDTLQYAWQWIPTKPTEGSTQTSSTPMPTAGTLNLSVSGPVPADVIRLMATVIDQDVQGLGQDLSGSHALTQSSFGSALSPQQLQRVLNLTHQVQRLEEKIELYSSLYPQGNVAPWVHDRLETLMKEKMTRSQELATLTQLASQSRAQTFEQPWHIEPVGSPLLHRPSPSPWNLLFPIPLALLVGCWVFIQTASRQLQQKRAQIIQNRWKAYRTTRDIPSQTEAHSDDVIQVIPFNDL